MGEFGEGMSDVGDEEGNENSETHSKYYFLGKCQNDENSYQSYNCFDSIVGRDFRLE